MPDIFDLVAGDVKTLDPFEIVGQETPAPKSAAPQQKQLSVFDPEGGGFDMDTANAFGMKPLDKPGDPNQGHYGSVVPATPGQVKAFGIPEGSYMLLKGRQHPTFDKAVEAEQQRGFVVKKAGDRYFSIPSAVQTDSIIREPTQSELDFFKRSGVPAYAAPDNKVVVSPDITDPRQRKSLLINESARVFMRQNKIAPEFELTDEQARQFSGYGTNEQIKRTLTARILAGDNGAPDGSKFVATKEQEAFAETTKKQMANSPFGKFLETGPPAAPVEAPPAVPAAPQREPDIFDLVAGETNAPAEAPAGTPPPDASMTFTMRAAETAKSLLEKPIERFQAGKALTGMGASALAKVPGVPTIYQGIKGTAELPGVISDLFGGPRYDIGDLPEAKQILPELPEHTPESLRPFLEYVRTSVDPVVGLAAATLGPVAAVTGLVSELLLEQPVRTKIKQTLTELRENPDSVPNVAMLPLAVTALKAAGFTLDDKDIDSLAESGATISGVLFGIGIGNFLVKSSNAAMRWLGYTLGGSKKDKTPEYKVPPGEAPMLPKAETKLGEAAEWTRKQFERQANQTPEFNQMYSERMGGITLGNMEAQRAFHGLEKSLAGAAKETGKALDDLRVDVGNALKGEATVLDPQVEAAMKPIREQINKWQQKAADAGLIPQKIVDESVDKYLYRGYMSKLDPATWKDVVEPGVVDKARAYLKEKMRVPVERDDPSRSPLSVVLENVRKQMQSDFRRQIREGRPDVGLAQWVTKELKKEVLGNEKANLAVAKEFLGTEGAPTKFSQMLADRIREKWNLSPQEASGAVRSGINAIADTAPSLDWKEMRAQMLKDMVKRGGVKPNVAGSIADAISDTRRAFDDMGETLVQVRKSRLTQKEVTELEQKFEDQLGRITGKGPISYRNATPDEVEGAIERILSGDDAFGFHAMQQGGRSARINLGPFTRRQDIPGEIRSLMGEIEEGPTAAALTISNLSRAVVSKQFLDKFAKGSELIEFGGTRQRVPWVAETRVPGYVKVEGSAWGPLDGKFVLEKYADDLRGFVEGMSPDSWTTRFQARVMNFFKVSKTITNPATHTRNILGNTMFADYAKIPAWDPRNAKFFMQAADELLQSGKGVTAKGFRAARGTKLGDEGVTELVREAIENGAISTEMFGSEVFKEALEVFAKNGPEKAAWEMAKRPIKAVGRVYSAEDQVFKLASYIKQRSLGMSGADAASHVRKWFPNYRDVAPAVQQARTSVMGAPFVSFASEAARINVTAMKEHPIKFGKWIMLVPAMTDATRAAYGIGKEQWEKVLKGMPSYYQQPMTGMPIPDADGNIQFADLTYTHPLGSILAGRRQGLDLPFLGEFVLNNPIWNTVMEAWADVDPLTGGPSRRGGEPALEYYLRLAIENFSPSLTPGIAGTGIEGGAAWREIRRAWRRDIGGEKIPGRFGQNLPLSRVLANELGPVRLIPADKKMEEAGMREKIGMMRENEKDLSSVISGMARGTIPDDVGRRRIERLMKERSEIVSGGKKR